MIVPRDRLIQESRRTGFRPEILEKVLQLLRLLEALNAHPALKGQWALKGGTALNLFHFALPRLSVDIDLNYVGAVSREDLDRERPGVEAAVQAVFAREGFTVRRVPSDHAGGKWRLKYASELAPEANLEVDLNFLLRVPLWEPVVLDSAPVGETRARGIPVLDLHELAAGKLAALFGRQAVRDLFDAHLLLREGGLSTDRLRLGFVVYGAMSRTDWRTVSLDSLAAEVSDLESRLLPLLASDALGPRSPTEYARSLAEECRAGLAPLFPFADAEREFLDRLLDFGEIRPEHLTQDADLAHRIETHPGLLWKALNVRKHRGL